MLRSLCAVLLLVFLSWSRQIDCADTTAASWISLNNDGFARDWRLKGNNVVKWQEKFNPHKQFYFLTYNAQNDYCEITQVSTESPGAKTVTCRYKFGNDEENLTFYSLTVPNKTEKNDLIEFSYTNAKARAKRSWFVITVNVTKCRDENLHKSDGNVTAVPIAPTNEVQTMTGPPPLPKITQANLISEANGRKTFCELNKTRTTITCTQWDTNSEMLLAVIKYNLPRNLTVNWFRIHNLKASGAVLLVFGDCPGDTCENFIQVKLSSKDDEHEFMIHPGLDLECSDVESNSTFDIADVPEGLCYHIVCTEDHYKKKSTVKTESLLQYRRFCSYGDFYN